MNSCLRLLFLGLLVGFGCKTQNQGVAELESIVPSCSDPVSLQRYLQPETTCTNERVYVSAEEARKRYLPAWIPCNDVEWVDDTIDFFGPGIADDAENLEKSNYSRIHKDWLGAEDRFSPALAQQVFSNLAQELAASRGNPILETALAQTIKSLIREAQHNIVMDIFLIGGSWGADILRDLASAAERGVKVVLLHDNVSKFSVANEMDALWAEAIKYSLKNPNFTALASNIHPPARVSSLPFGLEKISEILAPSMDLTVSAEGKSDHSKILFVDALYDASIDEYLTMQPRVMISSRNMVDSASSFYHDEAVVVKGPSAVLSLLAYQSDIFWAWDQASKTTPNLINAADANLVQSILQKLQILRNSQATIKGQGWISVQAIEISANDEVRNLDTGIIPKIMAAEHSIDIYNKIAYNWPLAMALKEAMARGVKVRIIMDQQNVNGALGNAVLPYMLMLAPRRMAQGKTTSAVIDGYGKVLEEGDLPVRWFLPFRPGKSFASKDRSDIAQEIHAKTIIIDNRIALFGSANLDSLSWTGGFREFSVWVDDPALAGQSAREFDRLWNHPLLTISHKVWLGDALPPPDLLAYLRQKQVASGCVKTEELCDFTRILQGGKDYLEFGPKRELIRGILANDAERIRLARPAMILQDAAGHPQCRKL